MKSEVRIVVVGDEKVGKTSLITALVADQFQEKVAPVVPVVTFPPEVNHEKVAVHIVDTSTRAADWPTVEEEIKTADCICVVYDVDKIETFQRVSKYWLPEIRRLRTNKSAAPIILVGNKIDKRGGPSLSEGLEQMVKPVLNEFKEVDSCVVCSAKVMLNVQEVFYFAQKAVLYPSAPLYNAQEHKLRPECVAALRRIFRLCDKDKDGFLSDQELNDFQLKCFNVPLAPEEIDGVKKVVKEGAPEGIREEGLTIIGFLYLHHLFIQKAKLDTTWTVLRKFHYGDDLKLNEDFLVPDLGLEPGQTCELSSSGYQFFTDLFRQYDRDEDGALSPNELAELFITSPGQPWGSSFPKSTQTNAQGYVTLQGFLAQWSMTTLIDYKVTLSYLAYLGFENTPKAVTVTRGRRNDLKKKKISRNVFQAFVFGSSGCGKTAFLNAFINKEFDSTYIPTTSTHSVVNAAYIDGNEKYLVLREFTNPTEVIRSKEKLEDCDLVIFLFDSHESKSFQFVSSLHKELIEYQCNVPVTYFATKADLPQVQQSVSPQDFCASLNMPPPKLISVQRGVETDVFNGLVTIIFSQESSSNRWAFLGLGLLVVVIVGGVVYWKYRK